MKSERGSITLFVLIAMIFFVAIAMTAYVSASSKLQGQNAELERIKASYEQDLSEEGLANLYKQLTTAKTEEKTKPELPSTNETKPWLPTGCEITNNDLSTGVTIKDSNDNEWTWVVVPKIVTTSAADDTAIETALRTYCTNNGVSNTQKPNGNDYSYIFTDTWWDGCGLTETQYNSKKSKMLNSIKKNGGFWIGKYEVGFTSGGPRSYETVDSTEHPLDQIPVIKQNAFPYNWIRYSQAGEIVETLTSGLGGTGSIMFGIQWDLTLAYLKLNTGIDINNSTSWGNHKDSAFSITNTRAQQSTDKGASWTGGTAKLGETPTILTTGATNEANKLNIYDLAGNLNELVLERSSDNSYPGVYRGGSYSSNGDSSSHPTAIRRVYNATNSSSNLGFRPALY